MAVTVSVNACKAKRSWADIVKGDVTASAASETVEDIAPEETAKHSLQPAARGTYLCRCLGEVLVMLGHYGWIKPAQEIDHPDSGKNGGRIYVHKRDIKSDAKLAQGDVVSFYLYSDDQGLGAEYCQLKERAASEFRADAPEFMPAGCLSDDIGVTSSWNLFATEFVPSANTLTSHFNPEAAEFDPSAFAKRDCFVSDFISTTASEKHSNPNVFAINPAFLSDDEESDDAMSFNDADVSDIGDEESVLDESDESDHDPEVKVSDDLVVVHVPFCAKDSISDGSTSVGGTSDSEVEDRMICLSRPPGLELPLSRPPGLDLPAGFRPPPGL
jgi:cold shock CspA family protein